MGPTCHSGALDLLKGCTYLPFFAFPLWNSSFIGRTFFFPPLECSQAGPSSGSQRRVVSGSALTRAIPARRATVPLDYPLRETIRRKSTTVPVVHPPRLA